MQTFEVVKEQHGWAVRCGRGVSIPFWTEAVAMREAERLCEGLRRHGVLAQVVVNLELEPRSIRADADAEADRGPSPF